MEEDWRRKNGFWILKKPNLVLCIEQCMGGHIGFGLNRHHPNRFSSFILGGISPQKVDKELKEKIEGYHELFKGGAQNFLSYLQTRGVEITPEVKEEIEHSDFEALKAFFGSRYFL